MRTIFIGLLLLNCAGAALALDKTELDNRIRKITAKFEALQAKPDKAIPAETLRQAHGLVLLDRTKAGFIFAYQGGGGVAMVKDSKTEKWSPAAFLSAGEASLGFQIGGQKSFMVILLMNTNAALMLIDSDVQLGGEASGTAGNSSAAAEGNIATTERAVLIYDDRKGLYGGATIKGGALAPDDDANQIYYGQYLSLRDILYGGKLTPSEPAAELARKINQFARKD